MIAFIVFYWLFAYLFMCGWLHRVDAEWGYYILAFMVAGLFFPFVLGYNFCSTLIKIEKKYED